MKHQNGLDRAWLNQAQALALISLAMQVVSPIAAEHIADQSAAIVASNAAPLQKEDAILALVLRIVPANVHRSLKTMYADHCLRMGWLTAEECA